MLDADSGIDANSGCARHQSQHRAGVARSAAEASADRDVLHQFDSYLSDDSELIEERARRASREIVARGGQRLDVALERDLRRGGVANLKRYFIRERNR